MLFVFVFFNFHTQTCVKFIEEPAFIGQLANWSIQWQWSFKSSGATTATVLWASVSFSCKKKKKELSLQRPYPRPSACAGNLCVCVGVRDYTTCVPLIQRWRLCRPAGVSCSALRLSDRNGQMTVSAKNVLKKKNPKKTPSANLSSLLLLLLLHHGWSFHKQQK